MIKKPQDTCPRLQGYELPVVSCQLIVTSYQLLVISYQEERHSEQSEESRVLTLLW